MIGKYGLFVVISLLAVLACPPALASEVGEYELVATWGSLGADDGRFNNPTGIAVDGEGNVYVADTGNDRIQKFDNTGAFLLKWGTRGSGDGEFYSPRNIALDADGMVYVVDGSRIQVFAGNGTFIKKWGSYGSGEEQLQSPRSIAFDTDGNAYVIAGGGIKKFGSDGNFLTAWGALGTYDGEFNNPTDVAVDGAGNVYVADCYNNRIQKFDGTGTFLLKWGTEGSGDGQFRYPEGLTTDTDGNVYVTQWNRPIQKFDSSGNLLAISTDPFYVCNGIAVDADGTVYVANSDDHCVRVFERSQVPTPTPNVVLDVVLNNSRLDSVNGRSISRNTALAFKLTNNLNGFSNLDVAAPPAMKIDVTLPGGGVTNLFGGVDLTAIPMNGTTVHMAPINLTGVEAGTYTAQAKWPSTSDFYGKGLDSNTVIFQVTSGAVGITSNKDTVVRGNPFTVTITGESGQDYFLTIENPGAQPPTFRANQLGVTPTADVNNVTVRITAAGTRSVELLTNTATREASYTLRVTDSRDASRYDEVRVRVETGSVTITASGTGVYYIGEEITLSGTNSDSDTTYLFLTGPNLPTNGVRLLDVTTPVENGDPATFTRVYVEADDTWSYKWNTADVGRRLNASGYTIYAAAQPQGKGNLTGVRLATTSIVLRAPSLTIQPSGATLTPGDDYRVSGIATGYPYAVQVWILGPDYYHSGAATVESDGTFEYVLAGADTSDLTEGRYYVIVQNPGCNGFDIWVSHLDPLTISGNGIIPVVLGNLGAADAASALINALDSPNIDDIYANFTFIVGEATFNISPDAITPGETITVDFSDLPDGAAFSLGIRGDFAANPEETFAFTIRDLTLPFALTSGEVNAYTKGTDWTELTAELPDGDSVIMRYNAGPNGEVRISQPRNIPSGTLSLVTLRGEAAATSIIADLTVLGTKQGPNDGTISFAIEGVDQGTATVTVFVDGSQALSRAIAVVGDPAPLPGDNLTLSPGWNFVSIPRPLAAGNDTTAIFAGVDVDGHSALRYDTANRSWINLKLTDRLAPLEGYWIYSAGPATVPLNFSTDPLISPAERALAAGWNAVGITGSTPATARDAFHSVKGQWSNLIGHDATTQTFEAGIVNGGSGEYADDRLVYQGRGYWLHMTEPGTLGAIGA
ncbi:DUF3821 domain-containing protein [Methanoculleus sp. FWC-SCC3]|uniref:DUF3821 domain-containing protein n=1 Tax=Methanoculleus methanifontis TaxID=2584086 RepID=A0ABT8M4Z1_9EURY|nr:hypothetical protein [Methanoculleus sp. FWC-SCC3]MDN7013664.1 DUF3821 domain-containing protein [Methanoculleus sp. FWC-SCC3]